MTRGLGLGVAALLLAVPALAVSGGPEGIFQGETGQVTLRYLGEGTVHVTLKTAYCSLDAQDAGTFVFPEGIHVHNEAGQPLLVIFWDERFVVVWGELESFKHHHCSGGWDATGRYTRVE